jgi:hypothetical protein
VFIGVEQYTNYLGSNSVSVAGALFGYRKIVDKTVLLRPNYDALYQGTPAYLVYNTDKLFLNLPFFDCREKNCNSIYFSMEPTALLFDQVATFDIVSLFGVISSFGGLHSIMSLITTLLILLYLRIWVCVAGQKVASIVNRPTSTVESLTRM